MVLIKGRGDFEYERVEIDTWIYGTIKDVQYRRNENRKFRNPDTGEWETKAVDELRFVFELDGYKYPHYSRWITQSVAERSNLYKKYLSKLVPNLPPNTDFDPDVLKGMRVKVMWDQDERDGEIWQYVSQIKPAD